MWRFSPGLPRTARAGFLRLTLTVGCLLIATQVAGADEDPAAPDKPRQDAISKRRLELMTSVIEEFKITAKDESPASAVKLGKAPLLRYNDATRSFLDASLWRLGESGRPRGAVTLELYRASEGTARLTYEFISLSSAEFSLVSPRGVQWLARGSELQTAVLPDASSPSDNAKGRLVQMRQLARRFAVRENYRGDKVECRLMPTPIDRYADPGSGIVDGAWFAFTNGTNPELGLLLECNETAWTYGTFRMGAAALSVDLDGKSIREIPTVRAYSTTGSYTSASHQVALPD